MTPTLPIFLHPMQKQASGVVDMEKRFQKSQQDISNGGLSENYSKLRNPGSYITEEIQSTSIDNDINCNTFALQRMKAKQNSLSQIKRSIQDLLTYIPQVRSEKGYMNTEYSHMISIHANSINQQLNAKFQEGYLFSGTYSKTPPTQNLGTISSLPTGTQPSLDYNNGNDQGFTLDASDGNILTDDVTSASPCFQQLVCGLRILKGTDGSNPQDLALTQGFELLTAAFKEINAAEATINLLSQTLEKTQDQLKDTKIKLQSDLQAHLPNILQSIEESNEREAMLDLSQSIVMRNMASLKELSQQLGSY